MARWVVIICVALLAPMARANNAGPSGTEPSATAPQAAKPAKRKAKPAKPPAPKAASPKPLHLGLPNKLSFKNHRAEWHLANVPAPELNSHGAPSGLRALALVGPLDGEQHVEFGVAPLASSKAPPLLAVVPDGAATAGPSWRTLVPGAQVYLRYRW